MKNKVSAALEAIGISDKLPDEYVRRLNVLRLGSVEPEIDHEDAKKIADYNALVFSKLTDEIMILTGYGKSGESNASGPTRKSKQV